MASCPRKRLRFGDQLNDRGAIHDFLLNQLFRQRVEDHPLLTEGLADPRFVQPESLDVRLRPRAMCNSLT